MRTSTVAVLLALSVTFSVCSAFSIPAFLWSGKDYLSTKYAHIGTQQQLLSVVDNQLSKNPKIFIAFLHKNLPSNEFLKHSGAFGESDNAFVNLENQIKNQAKTSIVYPNCAEHPSTTFSDFVTESKNAHVVRADQVEEFVQNLDNWKPADKNVVVVQFGDAETKEQFAHYDDLMNKIVEKADKHTNGDYIAMFSSETTKARRTLLSKSQPEEVLSYDVLFDARKIMQATPTPTTPKPYDPIPGMPNSTYVNPSYITGPIFGGVLVSVFLLALLAIVIYGLVNIGTAPRMTDIDLDGASSVLKKQQ